MTPAQTVLGAGVLFAFGHGFLNSVLPPEPAIAAAPVAQIAQVAQPHCVPFALSLPND